MKENIEERACELAVYILENKANALYGRCHKKTGRFSCPSFCMFEL